VWIKLSLIEFESCLKPFDLIQTHLPSGAPPVTLSPFFSLSLSAARPHPPAGPLVDAPALSLLSSPASPVHDPPLMVVTAEVRPQLKPVNGLLVWQPLII
jgi:hypothetical protein